MGKITIDNRKLRLSSNHCTPIIFICAHLYFYFYFMRVFVCNPIYIPIKNKIQRKRKQRNKSKTKKTLKKLGKMAPGLRNILTREEVVTKEVTF